MTISPNQPRQPTPGARCSSSREPSARRGCAYRSVPYTSRHWPARTSGWPEGPRQASPGQASPASVALGQRHQETPEPCKGETGARRRMGCRPSLGLSRPVGALRHSLCGVLPRATPLADSGLALGWLVPPRWGFRHRTSQWSEAPPRASVSRRHLHLEGRRVVDHLGRRRSLTSAVRPKTPPDTARRGA